VVFSFSNFFWTPGSSGILTGLRYVINASGVATPANTGIVYAHLYLNSPSAASGLIDQNMYPTLIADDALKLGVVQFNSSNWFQGGTGSNIVEAYGQQIIPTQHLIGLQQSGATPGSATLYVVLVAGSSINSLSGAVNYLYASGVMD
jgi:hypothetical protein